MKKSEIKMWLEKKLIVAQNKLDDENISKESLLYWTGAQDALKELQSKI